MSQHPNGIKEPRPRIDFTPALGEAGHEVKDLGYDGIADTAPALDEEPDEEQQMERVLDLAVMEFPAD